MTTTQHMEGQKAELASASSSMIGEQPQDDNEARKKSAVAIAVYFGTVLLLKYAVESLAGHGDKPALLVLELSTWLSFLLYLWAVYVAHVLASTDPHRRLGVRALLAVLASIVAAVAVSVLAFTFVSAVVGMVVMYLVSLCVAGFFAWCLGDYLRTRNSAEIAETSASGQQEKPVITSTTDESQEALLEKKSSSKPNLNLTHEHKAGDLEAGLLLSSGA